MGSKKVEKVLVKDKDKVFFYLDRLKKTEIDHYRELYFGGNLSRLLNVAIEYLIQEKKSKSQRLEDFIVDRTNKRS